MDNKLPCIRCKMRKNKDKFGDIKGTKKVMCMKCEDELSKKGYFSVKGYLWARGLLSK